MADNQEDQKDRSRCSAQNNFLTQSNFALCPLPFARAGELVALNTAHENFRSKCIRHCNFCLKAAALCEQRRRTEFSVTTYQTWLLTAINEYQSAGRGIMTGQWPQVSP